MHITDRKKVLDEFLSFVRKDVLAGPGRISHELAAQKAKKICEIRRKSANQFWPAKVSEKEITFAYNDSFGYL
jgi:hypothetical protein